MEMPTFKTRSHNTRSSKLTNPITGAAKAGRACAQCGAECARKYCGVECYRAVQRSADPVARFWSYVDRSDADGCWPWTGNRTGGRGGKKYGQFTVTVDGKQQHIYAHVYAYELANGPVPDGLEVMHGCHVRLCCRPSHLEAGTHAKNVQDSAVEGHYNVPHIPSRKITDDQVIEILSLRHRDGLTLQLIAERYGVTKACISQIASGQRRICRKAS
jgi:hypothetical protein